MDWRTVSLVALGGALGSVARFLVAGWTTRSDFPLGTFVVNALGCFLIGLLLAGPADGWPPQQARALLAIGILGGFTTMSGFTHDTLALLESSRHGRAVLNVGLTLVTCLAATWLGRTVGVALRNAWA